MPDTALESTLSQFVLERACLLVFVTNRQGHILQANQYAENVTGRELAGGTLSDVIVDFAGKFTLEPLREEETPSMWSVTTTTGLPKTFNFHFIDHGERVISIGEHNHRDSEVLEANLIHLNREVGNMNRDLQKRTAELERLHEEKNRFIGIAAHDLRNPIGAIHSLTDHLYRSSSASHTDEELEILSTIHESSGFMLTLIDELLSIATIES
ncbi:MAG: histidine kinase dimerization/phospho-acceptor domain-containing protein, partial [Spirochaetia bacterium]